MTLMVRHLLFRPMKLGVITAMHERHALTRLWADHTAQFGIPVFAAITEGDSENVETAKRLGFAFVEMPNNPVGDKFQAALDMAMEAGCDAVMRLPSDDFISQEWMDAFREKIGAGADYFIPDRIAIHDPCKGSYGIRAKVNHYFMKYGAGACFSRKAIEKCGGLWVDHKDNGLDSESDKRLRAAGFVCEAVDTNGIPLVDIKTGENIWPWGMWQVGGFECSDDEALHMLSPAMRQALSTNSTPTRTPVASEL